MKKANDRLFFKDKLTGEGEEQFFIILHMLECDGELIDFNRKLAIAKEKAQKKEKKNYSKKIKLLEKEYQKCIRELDKETKKMMEELKIKI